MFDHMLKLKIIIIIITSTRKHTTKSAEIHLVIYKTSSVVVFCINCYTLSLVLLTSVVELLVDI